MELGELFDFYDPVIGIRFFAELNAGEEIVKVLGNFANFEIIEDVFFSFESNRSNRRNDGCSASAEDFGGVEDFLI